MAENELNQLEPPKPDLKTGTIGLLTAFSPEIFRSEYFTRIISGIVDALRPTPYELKLIMVRDENAAEPSEKIIQKHAIDGLLSLTWRIHPRYIEEAQQGYQSLPIVVINDFTPDMKANIVYSDAAAGARLAVNYFLNRGYRRIGMLQGPDEASLDARGREKIFRQILKEEKIELDPAHFKKCDYFFEEDGYLKTLEMIQSEGPLPRALLCFNDDLALGALRAFNEEKISVPQEVAVIGFDGLERGKYSNPPITTVRQPLEQMGREMVKVVTGLIRGELRAPVQVRFDPQLVIRQSA